MPLHRPFSILPVVTAFTLPKAFILRNVPFFFSLLPRSRLAESCFRSVGLFPPGWNDNFHSWRFSVESLGHLIRPVSSPRFKSLGCRLPGLPGSCPIELLPPSRSGRASIAAAPVLHTLRQPCFPWKLRLRGCCRCLRLRILSGNHLWVIFPAQYPSLASSPSTLVASWSGSLGACLQVFSLFLFLWSLRHSEVNGWGAGMGLPIGLFLFQLWGCPASAVAVAGIRCRVLQARPFFGTVTWYLFNSSLPLLRSPVSLRRSGCACLRLRPCDKCLRLCLRKVP